MPPRLGCVSKLRLRRRRRILRHSAHYEIAVRLGIHNWDDAGNTTMMRGPLTVLAALLDRIGCYEPAATIAGFAVIPFTSQLMPEINVTIAHLRAVLGDQTYESFARKGETTSTAAMVSYAYGQIDQARAKFDAVAK